MIKIVLGVAFKVLKTVFKKIAQDSQKAETNCMKVKNKAKKHDKRVK
jgi:hypothetical protein